MTKRILYIGNDLQVKSFTATYISFLSTMLEREGYQVKTASTRSNKGVRLLEMLSMVISQRNRTDIVLIDTYGAMNFYYAYLVAKTCKKFNIPYIPILHGGNLPERLEDSESYSKKLFGNAKVNVAPSGYLYNAFKQKGFNNTYVVPNAIEIEHFPFKERKKLRPSLLWVRRFQKRYNPLLALKTLSELMRKYPDAELCMVGPEKDGSMQTCKALVKKHKLPVRFAGKLEKKEWANLSKDYDFFINTTTVDNTPISVIEAMSLGMPIISTNVGGMSDLIVHEKDGMLVKKDDKDAMAAAITELIENPEKATKICMVARKKAESFDWENVKAEWNKVLH